MADTWGTGTRTWGDATPWWGTTATQPRQPAAAPVRLVFQSAGVTAPFCVLSGTHQASWADGWVQADTVLATVEATTLPSGYHYGDLVTLRQDSLDPTNVLVGPWGRYRMIGVAAPGVDRATRQHTLALEAHDWVRVLLDRAISTSGVTSTQGIAALIQIEDMLRGALVGPVPLDTDFLAAAGAAFFGHPAPEDTLEYLVFATLWYLTGSTAATPWVVVDGTLRDLTAAGSPIQARTDAFGFTEFRWSPWGRLNYDAATTYRQVLTELCAPRRPGRTSFSMVPITASYDAAGVLHLRHATERWWQGWGWHVATDAHDVPLGLPVGTYSVTQREPEHDHVRVWAPVPWSGSPAGYLTVQLADDRAFTSWYTWRADLERPLDEFLTLPGSFTGDSFATHYAVQLADADLLQALLPAYEVQLPLVAPWFYPQLGQEVQCFDPPGLSLATRLDAATTPLNGKGGNFTLHWRADLG